MQLIGVACCFITSPCGQSVEISRKKQTPKDLKLRQGCCCFSFQIFLAYFFLQCLEIPSESDRSP